MIIQDAYRYSAGIALQIEQSAVSQSAMAIVKKSKDLRNDTDFFEKVCQVAFASLQLVMIRFPEAAYLSRMTFVLQTALLHDAYSFLKQPRQWFFPISADTIDEDRLLQSLTDTLQVQLDPTKAKVAEIETLAKEFLTARLTILRNSGDSYRNVDELKDLLQKKIRGWVNPAFNLSAVDLSTLEVDLRYVPVVERMMNINWTIVDTGCVGLFLQDWKLLDTAKWADRIGQIPGFQWVPGQSFETWVIGLVCTGFAMRLYEAVRKLYQEPLTEQDQRQAHWNVVTSVAELVFYGSIYLNRIGKSTIAQSNIYSFAILAKSLGLLCIATRPDHQFFQPKMAAAA